MNHVTLLDAKAPGEFAPLLAGSLAGAPDGIPVLLGSTREGMPCGALSAVQIGHSLLLQWVAVDPPFRRLGIGKELLNTLCTYAAARGLRDVYAVVCLSPEDAASAEALLRSEKFKLTEKETVFSFPLSSVISSPLSRYTPDPRAVRLSEALPYQIREFNHRCARTDHPACPPILPSELIAEASILWLEKGQITGCLLLAPCGDEVELKWLYGTGPTAIRGLLSAGCTALSALRPPDTSLCAAALDPSSEKLIRLLAGSTLRETDSVCTFRRVL